MKWKSYKMLKTTQTHVSFIIGLAVCEKWIEIWHVNGPPQRPRFNHIESAVCEKWIEMWKANGPPQTFQWWTQTWRQYLIRTFGPGKLIKTTCIHSFFLFQYMFKVKGHYLIHTCINNVILQTKYSIQVSLATNILQQSPNAQ